MKKIKCFLIALIIMAVVSISCLWMISYFAYSFKWQADKAMIGIIATYILTGLMGGICIHKMNRGNILEALFLGSIYMISLPLVSSILFENDLVYSPQFFRIYGVMICSVIMGRMLAK